MPGPSITAKTSVEVAVTRTQSEKAFFFFFLISDMRRIWRRILSGEDR